MDDWRRTHEWGALTRQEIAQARDAGALAVLTVGSTEQHADHLPVITDTASAYEVALRAADRCAAPHVLVLPPPSFGFSPHHQAWPGTITLSLSTFMGLIDDVADSVHRAGFDRLLIVNGHGGNIGPLTAATTALVSRGRRVAFLTYFTPSLQEWLPDLRGARKGVGHACEYETAMIMAMRPDERQRIAGKIDGLPPILAPAYAADGANPFEGTGAVYAALFPAGDPGYQGDPAAATVATGELVLEKTVAGLATFYATFAAAHLRAGTA